MNTENQVKMSNSIILHRPHQDELKYRKVLREKLEYPCEKDLDTWYKDFNLNMRNHYAFILNKQEKKFIGDVAITYDFKNYRYVLSILVEQEYQNKGFGKEALTKMLDYAFNTMNLDAIYEDCSISQKKFKPLYQQLGFEPYEKNVQVLFKKQYQSHQKKDLSA